MGDNENFLSQLEEEDVATEEADEVDEEPDEPPEPSIKSFKEAILSLEEYDSHIGNACSGQCGIIAG